MAKKYDYKILPETWKARVLVAFAMVAGLVLIVGYYAFLFVAGPGFIPPWWFMGKMDVTYVNQTDERVRVYKDERLSFTIDPGESITDTDYKIEWWWDRDVAAYDEQWRAIFADELDRDDLKHMDYRIVIDD